MENSKPTLSIVTPAYNRRELLKKCYESLLLQTCMDFEWIIVDDGSTDDTQSIVNTFSDEHFPVYYVRKENGGKHTALNASHPYIRGEYVLILDSDDTLTATAVEEVCQQWQQYSSESDIAMVVFLKGNNEDKPGCTVNDYDTPVDILRYSRNRVTGTDCCEVIRTELFKQYPFPVFEGERFLSEGALWNRVAKTHQCVYINKVIYLCEYLDGGLTKSGRAMRIRNPLGGMYSSELCMQPKNFLSQRIKKGMLYCCYGFFAGMAPVSVLKRAKYKLLTGVCMLPGYLLYRLWKKRYQ